MATAPAAALEEEGDLLRVRRYPKEAVGFYQAALSRFGETASLLNKMGMTQMELGNVVLAESYFRRAVKQDSRNWQGWNNLAAIAYLQRQYEEAINGYKKSLRINRTSAVSHVNLCTVYFEIKQYDKALREAGEALRVDENAFIQEAGLRVAPRVLPAEERARIFFEMAKLFGERGLKAEMLRELAQAQESGMDVLIAMSTDRTLSKYVDDPRITSSIQEAKSLRHAGSADLASVSSSYPHTAPLDTIK